MVSVQGTDGIPGQEGPRGEKGSKGEAGPVGKQILKYSYNFWINYNLMK